MPSNLLDLEEKLEIANATIEALLSGQIDAVVRSGSTTPVLLSAAQKALRESEAQYRQIVEATNDGIFKTNTDEVIVFINQRLAQLLGYTPAELIGLSAAAFLNPAALAIAKTWPSLQLTVTAGIETTLRCKGGTNITVDLGGTRLAGLDVNHLGSLGVVRDATERNKLVAQVMVSDRMASVGMLAAGVAHEINNPLAFVVANLHFVAEELSTLAVSVPEHLVVLGECQSAINDAKLGAERVNNIVRDLKTFSRSDDEVRGPVELERVLNSTVGMAWNEIRHRARLVKDFSRPSLWVEGNESRLCQLFLNLLVNAAQAIPAGAAERNEIRLVTRTADDGRVIVEVTDTGEGMSPEVRSRLFTPFFTTKPRGVGTGLGLSLCHKIASSHGGEIHVESTLGEGTTFRVILPSAGARVTAQKPEPQKPELGPPGRVLVVDDEPMLGAVLRRIIGPHHAVVTVTDGTQALAQLALNADFDLVLCDLMMPQMSGPELFAKIALAFPRVAERIVFMTGGVFTDDVRRFLETAPNLRIHKPFAASQVRGLVTQFVNRRRQGKADLPEVP